MNGGHVATETVSSTATSPRISLLISRRWVLVSLGLFTGLSSSLYFLPAFTPDEIWFYRDAEFMTRTAIDAWRDVPHLGYGAAFWGFYCIVIKVFANRLVTLYVLRSIAFLLAASVPILLYRAGVRRKSQFTLLAILFWFALPLAWWNGKIVSPEIPSYCFCLYAFLLLRDERYQTAGWLLWGFAAGLKLTVLPTFPLLLLTSLQTVGRKGLFSSLAAILGFVAANPILVLNPRAFVPAISVAASPVALSWGAAKRELFSPYWEWDGVPSGGIFVHGIALAAAILLVTAFVLAVKRREPESRVFAGTILMWFLTIPFCLRARFLTWYVFPTIVLTTFVILFLQPRKDTQKILVAALAGQLIFGLPVIYRQYRSKVDNTLELQKQAQTRQSIQQVLLRWRPTLVADDVTIGRFQLENSPSAKIYLGEMESHVWIFGGLANAHWPGPERHSIVMIVNHRLTALNPKYDVIRNLQDPSWRGSYSLVEQTELPTGTMYLLSDQPK
jgi:hypothetical protein